MRRSRQRCVAGDVCATEAHGDDFVFVGVETDLEWARRQGSCRYWIGSSSGRVMGSGLRQTRVTKRFWLGNWTRTCVGLAHLEWRTRRGKIWLRDGDKTPLNEIEEHSFRSTAARAHYLAWDRPDLAFASKEWCRRMSAPTSAHSARCPGICYCRLNTTRTLMCLRTRIAGGVWPLGGAPRRRSNEGLHLIKHWRSTQKAVALSSAEAELCGIVRGTTEALGIQSVGQHLGLSMPLSVHGDSAAPVGLCKRAGVGWVTHLGSKETFDCSKSQVMQTQPTRWRNTFLEVSWIGMWPVPRWRKWLDEQSRRRRRSCTCSLKRETCPTVRDDLVGAPNCLHSLSEPPSPQLAAIVMMIFVRSTALVVMTQTAAAQFWWSQAPEFLFTHRSQCWRTSSPVSHDVLLSKPCTRKQLMCGVTLAQVASAWKIHRRRRPPGRLCEAECVGVADGSSQVFRRDPSLVWHDWRSKWRCLGIHKS